MILTWMMPVHRAKRGRGDAGTGAAFAEAPAKQQFSRWFIRFAVLILTFNTVPARALDLMDSYLAAQNHDSILASAHAAHTGGIEVVEQAKAHLGTAVQVSASASLLDTHLTGLPRTIGYTKQELLSLNQPLYHRADWIALDQAHARVTGLDSQLVGAEQDLVVRVAQAYFNILLAQDMLQATLEEEKSIGQQLALSKRSYEVGTVAITDVTDAQARYDVSVAEEAQDRGNLEIARRAFELLTGVSPESLAGVSTGAWLRTPQPDNLQYWISAAMSRSPAVVQAAATLDVQQKEVDHARAARYPTFDLVSSVSKQSYNQADLNVLGTGGRTSEIGIQVSLTIWDGGMINSNVRQATAGADQAIEDLQTSRNVAVQNARQSYIGVSSTVSQVHAYEQAVASGRVSLDGALRGLEAGTRTAVDVLNARQLLFQTLRQLAAARYSVVLYMLQLKSAVGELSARDLDGLTSASAPPGLFDSEPPIPR